jgi:hypothetical protein
MKRLPMTFRGVEIGTLVDPSADMYWWRARWERVDCEATREFIALVEAGEDPAVLVGTQWPTRLVATALADDELELKTP